MDDNAELMMMVGRMDANIAALVKSQEQQTKRLTHIENELSDKIGGLGSRLGKIEATHLKLKGAAVVLGALSGLFTAKIGPVVSAIAGLLGA